MRQNRFRLGLRHRPRWRSLKRFTRSHSWNEKYLLLRKGCGAGAGGEGEGRKGRGGEKRLGEEK